MKLFSFEFRNRYLPPLFIPPRFKSLRLRGLDFIPSSDCSERGPVEAQPGKIDLCF